MLVGWKPLEASLDHFHHFSYVANWNDGIEVVPAANMGNLKVVEQALCAPYWSRCGGIDAHVPGDCVPWQQLPNVGIEVDVLFKLQLDKCSMLWVVW